MGLLARSNSGLPMASGKTQSRSFASSRRVIIQNVSPEVDGGRFPIKRIIGDAVSVSADIFSDGHEVIVAMLLHRPAAQKSWMEVPMQAAVNDLWRAEFQVPVQGRHLYTLQAWVDRFQGWRRDLAKKFDAGQDVSVDVLTGVQLIERAAAASTLMLTTALFLQAGRRNCARYMKRGCRKR